MDTKNTVCCNQPLILFAHIVGDLSIETSYYHCDVCLSNYVSDDDIYITAVDIEPGILLKADNLEDVYKIYQRLYELYKANNKIDIVSYMVIYLFPTDDEYVEKFLSELEGLEKKIL